MYGNNDYRDYLAHYGVLGMKWGVEKQKTIIKSLKTQKKRLLKDYTKSPSTNPMKRREEYDKALGNSYRKGSLQWQRRQVELENKRRNPMLMSPYERRLYNSRKGNI